VDITADSQAIRDRETAWVKDWQAKDADKIVSHYAPDGVLLIADSPAMKGSDTIKGGIGGMLKDPHLSLTFAPTAVVIAKGGDIAYTQGVYTMTYSDPKSKATLIEKGKYVTVYQKQPDGTWMAVEDIDNEDAPPLKQRAERETAANVGWCARRDSNSRPIAPEDLPHDKSIT
jgi:uncharacterized protein (TIGR02246 family)